MSSLSFAVLQLIRIAVHYLRLPAFYLLSLVHFVTSTFRFLLHFWQFIRLVRFAVPAINQLSSYAKHNVVRSDFACFEAATEISLLASSSPQLTSSFLVSLPVTRGWLLLQLLLPPFLLIPACPAYLKFNARNSRRRRRLV